MNTVQSASLLPGKLALCAFRVHLVPVWAISTCLWMLSKFSGSWDLEFGLTGFEHCLTG